MADKSQSGMLGKSDGGYDDDPEAAKQKKMAILMGVLFVVFGIILFAVFGRGKPASAPPKEKAAPSVVVLKHHWVSPEEYPGTLRDPMAYDFPDDTPPVEPPPGDSGTPEPQVQDPTPVPVLPQLVVTGILFSDNPFAEVNGRYVAVGDVVEGATVTRIAIDRVEFEMNGQRWAVKHPE